MEQRICLYGLDVKQRSPTQFVLSSNAGFFVAREAQAR